MKPPNMDTQRDVEETDQLLHSQREAITTLERKKERKKTHETTKYGYTKRRRGNRPAPSSPNRGDLCARKKERKKERKKWRKKKEKRMKPPNMDTQRDVKETDQFPLPQREAITMLERKKDRKTHEATKYGYTKGCQGNRPAPSSPKRGDHYATKKERKKERKEDAWNHQIWIHKETSRKPTSSLFSKQRWSLC